MPLQIGPSTFTLVRKQLEDLDYTGPAGLACDDTKLHSALRLFYDRETKAHYLVGGASGPILVPDPKQMEGLMNDSNTVLATKVRGSNLTVVYKLRLT